MYQIVEHTEIDEHLEEIVKNLIVEHLFYTISIATNNRTPGIFFNCVNSSDTRVHVFLRYNIIIIYIMYISRDIHGLTHRIKKSDWSK